MDIRIVSRDEALVSAVRDAAPCPVIVVPPASDFLTDVNTEACALVVDLEGFAPETSFDELLPAYRLRFPGMPIAAVAEPQDFDLVLNAINSRVCDRLIARNESGPSLRCHLDALVLHAKRIAALREQVSTKRSEHWFVTGTTGFLGTEFLYEVLRSTNHRVTALCRANKGTAFDQRLPFKADDFPDRLQFVEGDIREPGLGLTPAVAAELGETVKEVWHFAAITSFDEILRPTIFKVNLEGTENLIAFSQQLDHLNCFNHISTAYVAGQRSYPDVVSETISKERPEFKNPYEESKYEAEMRVADSGLPYLIYRPSIVLGETVSGRNDGQTIYNVAKMVRLAKLLGDNDSRQRDLPLTHHSFRVVADPEAFKNLIPVDDVISMCLRLRSAEPAMGSVFHVTHLRAVPIGEIVSVIAGLLDTAHYEIVRSLEGATLSVPEEVLERVAEVFTPYMTNSDPLFDMTNVKAILGDGDMPQIDRNYLRFCLDTFYKLYFGAEYGTAVAGV